MARRIEDASPLVMPSYIILLNADQLESFAKVPGGDHFESSAFTFHSNICNNG